MIPEIFATVEDDFYWDTLNDFHEVSGCVLRREKRKARAGSRSKGIDPAPKNHFRICIDLHLNRLAHPHFSDLCFFEIRHDPCIGLVGNGNEWLPRLNV